MDDTWSDALLDTLSLQGDPVADAAVEAHAAARPGLAGGALVGSIAAHNSLPVEQRTPELSAFLDDLTPLPDWADPALMARSAAFFDLYGLEIGLALFCASLPEGYASPRGAKVLALTARLVTDPVRRIYETAQFLMDTMTAGGLAVGTGAGYHDTRHVRLMHAAVRHLIRTDPAVVLSDDERPEGEAWRRSWGVPLNQEDLLGALMTFTVAVFESLDAMGAAYDPADAEAYLHTWCIVGHMLGIAPQHLPLTRSSAEQLTAAIRRRNWGPSADGLLLGQALIDVLENTYRWPVLRGLPTALISAYTGERVSAIVGARPGAIRVVFGPARRILRRVALGEQHDRFLRWVTRRVSVAVLGNFVAGDRSGDRGAFTLPAHLGDRVLRPATRFRFARRK